MIISHVNIWQVSKQVNITLKWEHDHYFISSHPKPIFNHLPLLHTTPCNLWDRLYERIDHSFPYSCNTKLGGRDLRFLAGIQSFFCRKGPTAPSIVFHMLCSFPSHSQKGLTALLFIKIKKLKRKE